METAEIRQRFLSFYAERGHGVVSSSSLVPGNDPSLLFTNAGMVQFKSVFLGEEPAPHRTAVTSQKCLRAGGKHNDLEEVGRTARHHTFFEMLGNFSFGDYFKREAIRYAWDFLTIELGMDPDRLYATVHYTDDEAAELWHEVAGLERSRIYRLGDKDNFWQMADTGPCGPCSEVHYDLRPRGERGVDLPVDEFEEKGERGEFLELWNLVFMQFNRDEAGEQHPLPAPSIDTGAGLERLATVLQGVDSNYHIDLFRPLLERAAEVVGRPYDPDAPEGVSYRVLADHSRAVAFLLADSVYPSNEGRGYVLRRILRRGVRHAWLLGRREPTLVEVVNAVIAAMGETYPELVERAEHILSITRGEEERFLTTIEGGMERFEVAASNAQDDVIGGEEAFRLYDTFGFPLDLTQVMARERGYSVDVEGFEAALERQRERSRKIPITVPAFEGGLGQTFPVEMTVVKAWKLLDTDAEQTFVGYDLRGVSTDVIAVREGDAEWGVQLRENPFYVEAGGQISDRGTVTGDGWRLTVERIERVEGRTALIGPLEGDPPPLDAGLLPVQARVPEDDRHDTERNHTATHLLHAALRSVLGEHATQQGSLVAPHRLRFDFAHSGPMTAGEVEQVESFVNEAVWRDYPVEVGESTYDEAIAAGAMALFGEKYGDRVRTITIPGISIELCGGTHLRHTGEVGLFKVVSEGGVAAGVRRIEAVTGPGALRHYQSIEAELEEVSGLLRTPVRNAVRRTRQLIDEKKELERLLDEMSKAGGGRETVVVASELTLGDGDPFRAAYRAVRMRARRADEVRSYGDEFLAAEPSGVAVVAAELPGGKQTLFSFVGAALIRRGIKADEVVRGVAAVVGGRGGGRPHMAQAGVADPSRLDEALAAGEAVVRELSGRGGGP